MCRANQQAVEMLRFQRDDYCTVTGSQSKTKITETSSLLIFHPIAAVQPAVLLQIPVNSASHTQDKVNFYLQTPFRLHTLTGASTAFVAPFNTSTGVSYAARDLGTMRPKSVK